MKKSLHIWCILTINFHTFLQTKQTVTHINLKKFSSREYFAVWLINLVHHHFKSYFPKNDRWGKSFTEWSSTQCQKYLGERRQFHAHGYMGVMGTLNSCLSSPSIIMKTKIWKNVRIFAKLSVCPAPTVENANDNHEQSLSQVSFGSNADTIFCL